MKRSTKYLKITVNIISFIAVILICVFVLPKVIVFFMPFVIAGIIALIANPVVRFLEKRMKIVRKAGTAFVIIIVIALIVFLGYLIIAKIIDEIVSLAAEAPELWRRTEETLRSVMGVYNVYLNKMPVSVQNWLNDATNNAGSSATAWLSDLGTPIAGITSDLAQNVPLVIIGIIMAILASYIFLAERDYVLNIVLKVVPEQIIRRWNIVYDTMKDAVGGYLKAQFKIMGIVYLVLLIGLIILRQDNALLVAFLIALLDFLPFFGTGTVMIPWAIIKIFQADYKLAAGLLITWGASQLVRQLIQPKLVGDSMGLDPLPTLLLLYIGFRIKGAIGLILAVPIGMIVINLYKAGVFSNFVYSIKILFNDIVRFRRFTDEELMAEGITSGNDGSAGSGRKDHPEDPGAQAGEDS
ncbi:MAG: sporulation integral membrane protein YtvI [Lachnospiraceae bacterium]|nr:sporulation integral membrane protein YtvI [Lachnospiraceae bacterium]